LSSVQQVVDGFGGATVWNGQLSDAEMDVLFGNANTSQIGLTICRVHFGYDGNFTDDKANATKAKSRGATILASVWSPPASMKSNGNNVGGSLNTGSYAAYATWLSDARSSFGNVDIVSIQNEPNISVSYESCNWTAQQLLDFCRNNAQNIGGAVMMPEAYNFDDSYSDPTLNDATASSRISCIGGHIYGGGLNKHTNAINKGKKVWMTEHYYDPDDIGTCMTMAKEILDCMYNNMNAYVWWYVKTVSCNLIDSGGALKKKGYIMGQFSKYIRPGYNRVDATYNPQSSVYVSGYKGSKVVIVAVNQGGASISQQIIIQNGTISGVTKYVTSGSKSLSNDGSITLSSGSFTTTLDAQSITTFVQN
jgi:glucuronoarabinoxylan endo-1,4-beta-xylanase